MYKQHWEQYSTWYTKLVKFGVTVYSDGDMVIEWDDAYPSNNAFISIDDLQELLDDAKEYIEARKEYKEKHG